MNTYQKIQNNTTYTIPDNCLKIKTIDMHTGGEPLRVILDGFPKLKGRNILEYRRYVKEHYDHLRKALMFEPRGHADMYGCLLVPPNDEDADFGILFMHNEGYSTMCGHAIIAITTLAVEMGWVTKTAPEVKIKIDAPCGRITSYAKIDNGAVESVRFCCVPSFVVGLNRSVYIAELKKNIEYDLAYGGAFYAYVNADQLGLELIPENYRQLIKTGMEIKQAVLQSDKNILHPFEEDLSFLYGTIFIGGPVSKGIDSRNVCIFAEGEVDRCPTGSGVSGRMAIHYAKDEIKIGESMSIESITGSVFRGSVIKEQGFGSFKAVTPQVEGTAYITGINTFVIDPKDPFKEGFIFH